MKKKQQPWSSQMPRPSAKSDPMDVDIQSCSATDCTGLIPALPQTDAEVERYNQMYHFMPGKTSETDR